MPVIATGSEAQGGNAHTMGYAGWRFFGTDGPGAGGAFGPIFSGAYALINVAVDNQTDQQIDVEVFARYTNNPAHARFSVATFSVAAATAAVESLTPITNPAAAGALQLELEYVIPANDGSDIEIQVGFLT